MNKNTRKDKRNNFIGGNMENNERRNSTLKENLYTTMHIKNSVIVVN